MSVEFIRLFLSYGNEVSYTIKTLREDRTVAEWKNVACATRRRRRILLRRILFHKDGPHRRSCERRPSPLRYFL